MRGLPTGRMVLNGEIAKTVESADQIRKTHNTVWAAVPVSTVAWERDPLQQQVGELSDKAP